MRINAFIVDSVAYERTVRRPPSLRAGPASIPAKPSGEGMRRECCGEAESVGEDLSARLEVFPTAPPALFEEETETVRMNGFL